MTRYSEFINFPIYVWTEEEKTVEARAAPHCAPLSPSLPHRCPLGLAPLRLASAGFVPGGRPSKPRPASAAPETPLTALSARLAQPH